MEQRTPTQNRAMHKFFMMLSDELNTQGLDMKMVLKQEYEIWWTPEMVKEYLWKPLQSAMFIKGSTTELTTAQVDKVYEQLMKLLGEKFGVEVQFPSNIIYYEENDIGKPNPTVPS